MEQLIFIPHLLKDNEKLKTVERIEDFTGLAHNDAMILYCLAKTKKIIVSLTKNVTENDIKQLDAEDCITIKNVKTYKNKIFEWKDKYEKLLEHVNSHSTKPIYTEVKVNPPTTTLFGKPVVLLPNSEYNQMVVKLKEYDKLKDASNRAEILYENTIEKYKKQIEALQKYEYRYKDLRRSLENTLTQFK